MSDGPAKGRSRRELVADVLGAGARSEERKQLSALLEAEHLAIDVYGLAGASSVLSPPARRLIRQLRAQERLHAAALSRVLGGHHPFRIRSARQLELALSRYGVNVQFAELHTERGWFTLLENLEGALEGAYYKSLRHLSSPAVATLAARIMASEAQHSTLLFRLRNPHDIALDVAVGLVKGSAGRH